MMTQEEFLTKLFSLYATSFNRGNGQQWIDAYKQVLKPNIDYDKLYDYMLCNYAGAAAPSPSFLLKNATYIKADTAEDSATTETLIVRKGKCDFEYGVKLSEHEKDIKYFNKEGLNIIKLKYCDKNCIRCVYNHVCITAMQLRA